MEIKVLTRVVHTIVLLLFISTNIFGQDSKHLAEDLWQSIDFIAIKKSIQYQKSLSNSEADLYMQFLQLQFPEERSEFFKKAETGEITQLSIPEYTNALIQKYTDAYQFYLTVKSEFVKLQNETVYKPLSYNGPCENMDFEDGTTSGWQGSIATACERVTPCNVVQGFSTTRHQIMTTAMVDPYIPALPVVAPGGNYSLRLENYVNGGNAASARQTFLVTPTNNIFTYQYAAVLEDPGDHRDLERPYFKVRMYDQNGAEINCATYTAIAKPPIQNFTYARVPNPNYTPGSQLQNNQFLDLYYRNWTTITIPLLNYVGQNVTVEFTASDCSRGGHLGYAYIDASCSYLDTQIPPTICGSQQNVTLYGPDNFARYNWSGPGIVGSATTQDIQVNKSGVYKLTLTPVADNPCPVTVQTTVPERCLPVPITAQACETIKGTRIKNGIDLTNYNTAITAYNGLARVLEWHSGLPATTANKIANPTNINISNGSRYYAVIKYTSAGSDTAELKFTINSLPTLTFADMNPLCKSSATVNIAGVSPAGGTFSGAYITTNGVFTPSVAGTFPITYKYTTVAGCIDSIKKSVTVNPPPTLTLTDAQLLCVTATTVNLTATATNQTQVEWSGGAGQFLNKQNSTTEYTPTIAEKNSGSVTLTFTVTGMSPCPAISDDIVVSFTPSPTTNAGVDRDICVPNSAAIQLQGSSTNAQKNVWSGGSSGSFSNINVLNSLYTPTTADIAAGSITLTLTTLGKTPCAQVQDEMQIRFHDTPVSDAGPDQTVCTGTSVLLNTAPVTGVTYTWSSKYGVPVSSTASASIIADKDSTFILQLENQYGCMDQDTVTIDAFAPPQFNLGGPFCFSDQMLLNSNPVFSDQPGTNPIWYKDGIVIPNETGFSLSVIQQGTYSIKYKQGTCEVTSSANVYSNPILATPDQFTECEQNTIQLTTTNIPLATYYWQKNGNQVSGNTNSISVQASSTTDNYNIEVIDQHNCRAKDSLKVIGIPRPVLQLTDASICAGASLHIDGTPVNISALSNYTLTYKWFFNSIEIGKNANSVDVSDAGNYTLVGLVANCPDTARMNVTVNPLPVLDLPDVKKFCPESDHAISLNAGSHNSYLWTPLGETSQKISVTSGGFYTVTVYDNFDCFTKGTIEVKEICPPRLFVADAFSPNEDGTNDLFNVYGAHIGTYKLLIFNRWGEIIFESTNKDHFWDGIYKGEMMPIGVYPWIITYEGDTQEYLGPYKLEGSVTLVK